MAGADSASNIKLGLWGGVGGGKTTFLASLRTAMLADKQGGWSIAGHDDSDNQFLVENRAVLDGGRFPQATQVASSYTFHVVAPIGAAAKGRGLPAERAFDLEVRDYPGGHFGDAAEVEEFNELGEFLSGCAGFLYLYDPTSDENYAHFDRTMLQLVSNARKKGGAKDNRVDQFMAVCITKYDDPGVLSRLQDHQLIVKQPFNDVITPTVTNAREAFRVLADDRDPDLPPSMQKYFNSGHVEYFPVSSVGFYSKPNEPVHDDDCCNVVDTYRGPRLRSRIRPVGMLAPLDWLQRKVIR